ncbi:aggrecan core protein-like isoform x4 [Plakobranchus ocellatus]|uniref:Aggrecan core protein-like isoform x4 n=1 Tax=Plakobranchus ocellatus TaxID=259542 RepID=A0AAV4DLM0_9GAST|nr:aggrecan core protein-like isoform x4 [Plakobranchus ocellatus]
MAVLSVTTPSLDLPRRTWGPNQAFYSTLSELVLSAVYPSPLELSEGSRAPTCIFCYLIAQPLQEVLQRKSTEASDFLPAPLVMQCLTNSVFILHRPFVTDGTAGDRVTLYLEHPYECRSRDLPGLGLDSTAAGTGSKVACHSSLSHSRSEAPGFECHNTAML